MSKRFWQTKPLSEMNVVEWESLCDGCAKCCLQKLEDEDNGDLHYTRVACRHLDETNCRCSAYEQRRQVPHCVLLTAADVTEFGWLPSTCAYRLVAEGKPLPEWHHLISGSRETIHAAGRSVKGRVLSEEYVHPDGLEEHIVHWVG
ncbi:MAG: YcgN family cysteine cluster protein [Cellvibrionaceae bacterium]